MSALGAATDLPVSLTHGAARPETNLPPAPDIIEIPFVQVCRPKTKYRLSYTEGSVATLLAAYEFVSLVALTFAVEITGQSGKFEFAATDSKSSPSGDLDWLSSQVYKRFAGNAHGDTFGEFVFPSVTRFSKELKALSIGNDPPNFYFRFEADSGCSCSVRGSFTVRGHGHGMVPPISLTELASGKSVSDTTSSLGGK